MMFILSGEHHGQMIHHEITSDAVKIGRGSANDLVLASQTVSRNHAVIAVVEGGRIRVEDLKSLNGTRVNGQPVEGVTSAERGDTIEFGSVALRLTDGDQTTGTSPLYSDETDVSRSVVLSRDDITDSHSRISGNEPVLRLLLEAGELLVLPESPEQTFDRILELVEKTIPSDRILILVSEEPDEDPVQRAARVNGDRAIGRLMLSRTMVRKVVDEGAAFLTGDAQSDERFMNQQSIVAQDLRSAMAVPLVYHDDILGVLYVDTNDPLTTYSEHDLRVLTVLGQMLGAKIMNARLLERKREQDRLEEELKTARAIQRRLLPQTMPELDGWELHARQETCDDVGGDLYDAGFLVDGRIQICLGDVSGHGIPAAVLMADALATVRALRATGVGLGELTSRLDAHLLLTTEPQHYLTMFLAALDPVSAKLRAVNAGHPAACLIRTDGSLEWVASTSVPVGLLDIPKEYPVVEVEIPPGAALVIYSDGVTEAERGDGEQFGDHRFEKVLVECAGLSPEEIASRIESEVASWLGDRDQEDDLTLVVLRRSA